MGAILCKREKQDKVFVFQTIEEKGQCERFSSNDGKPFYRQNNLIKMWVDTCDKKVFGILKM